MAITVSSATIGSSAGTSSLSFAHTVGSGINLLLVLISHSRGADSISGVTFNGDAMTRATHSASNVGAYIYYLLSPDVATGNVVVSVSAGTDRGIVAGAVNVTTPEASPIGAVGTNSGVSGDTSVTVTTTRANSYVFDATTYLNTTTDFVKGGSQTELVNQNRTGTAQGERAGASYQVATATGDYTNTWNPTESTQWNACAVEIKDSLPSGPANLKSYNTNVKANIKSVNTNLIANVKSLNTNA